MGKELDSIITGMTSVLSGSPWYGKPVLGMLNEIDASQADRKPGEGAHSMIELLYHMVTWTEFTLHRIEKDKEMDNNQVEALDWRETNLEIHTWNNGISQFTAASNKIIELLKTSSDDMLEEKVEFRDYNFRHLLNGLIQHNIYHIGQVAYVYKLLNGNSNAI